MSAHDHGSTHNFEVSITGREGGLVQATVQLGETIPAGGITLEVVYDPNRREVVSVSPWQNLGQFVTAELTRQANS